MQKILIIGAASAIAEAAARIFAKRGDRLYLVDRNEPRLAAVTADLKQRGAESTASQVLDVNDFARHREVLDAAIATLGGIDLALIAHGTLPDQTACQQDVDRTLRELNTNAISGIALMTDLANRLEQQGHGTIAVISSVAGDRGRLSNYVYGAAKGALSIFCQGLRARMHRCGVNVLTIKPGFVDTPMTQDFKKGPLWSTPQQVAQRIVRAVDKRKSVAYVPGFWRCIMLVIKLIPEPIFKRMKL